MSRRSAISSTTYPLNKGSAFFVIPALLILWELFYYLGLVDPNRFSHPLGIFLTFGDWHFLRGFLFMLAQWTSAVLLGGTIGITVGAILVHNAWLTRSATRFLHVGVWIPFLVLWAIPIIYPKDNYVLVNVLLVWVLSIAAVSLFSCYEYLVLKSSFNWRWRQILSEVARTSILQGLFISFISQLFLASFGWDWYNFLTFIRPTGINGVYAAIILLSVILFMLSRVFRSNFEDAAKTRGAVIIKELAARGWSSLSGAILFVAVSLVIWQLLSLTILYPFISSPLDVVNAMHSLLALGIDMPYAQGLIWDHIGISILEVFGGLAVGGGIAFLTSRGSRTNGSFKIWAQSILPLTYVMPLIFSILLLAWVGLYGSSIQTALSVALLTFFPFAQALWGLNDEPLLSRLLLAVDEALPFAFVGMLFRESIFSVAGLGFFIVYAREWSYLDQAIAADEAIAASLVVILLLVVLSSSLRWLVKRFYFTDQNFAASR